ncbi:MAG: sodium:solute symporter [Bacteroidales bacterium]|nr:sodium:solute symporter [Bacteroidales bacterium]MCB8999757.1 sodium:solute symporter [Bacteroidales bacterium]MCB9013433.1 sodium:solute symporter [Bacteroidales bacterium]
MSSLALSLIILSYFVILFIIAWLTGRNTDNAGFFIGNRKSPWYVVSFGMIGASLSGVTFISVPGWVGESNFMYMQMVLGYLVGYFVIANVLMPMYYRLKLTSIYTYLETRFGRSSYKTGASFFLLSRTIGASFRLFLVANVLQITIFQNAGVPFWITVLITVALIWLFTFRGGIKTIIWTDTIQTLAMLTALVVTIVLIGRSMDLSAGGMIQKIAGSKYSQIFEFHNWHSPYHFFKQFIGGAFIAIVMTGLDQDLMQKNLSCRNIKEAKRNMYWLSFSLIPVNLLFLGLGALLFIYAAFAGINIPANTDDLFPLIATGGYLSVSVAFFFIIGLVSATYSSADSALTSLTTSFTIDILDAPKKGELKLKQTRNYVHIAFTFVLGLMILLFKVINDQNVIKAIFTIAGYTYGPLLGLYSFGLFTKRNVRDRFVPLIAVLSPLACLLLNYYSKQLLWGYKFGFELLVVNGLFTFIGLSILSIGMGKKVA